MLPQVYFYQPFALSVGNSLDSEVVTQIICYTDACRKEVSVVIFNIYFSFNQIQTKFYIRSHLKKTFSNIYDLRESFHIPQIEQDTFKICSSFVAWNKSWSYMGGGGTTFQILLSSYQR